jgi:hypothetical protein
MGDCQNGELPVHFDSRLKLRFVRSQVSVDAELLAYTPSRSVPAPPVVSVRGRVVPSFCIDDVVRSPGGCG